MFKLRRPCKTCPFRKGQGEAFALNVRRLDEIRRAVAFQCHGTVDYSDDETGPQPGDKPQQCAGLMAVLSRIGEPNQIMQVGERFGALDLAALDPGGVAYATWADVLAAHGRFS